jgi:hypothetical protein
MDGQKPYCPLKMCVADWIRIIFAANPDEKCTLLSNLDKNFDIYQLNQQTPQ